MGDFKFTSYLLFMFIGIVLLGVIGSLGASLLSDYDVETSDKFNNYIDSFVKENANVYADEDVLSVDKSDSGSGEFSEYESSFKFGDQIKQTSNQTNNFIKVTSETLGLNDTIRYIITGIVGIALLVTIMFFLRGIGE